MRIDPQISKAYAGALLDVAKKRGILQALGAQGLELIQVLGSNPKLRVFIESPNISDDEKESLFTRLFQGRLDATLFNFCLMMLRRRRLDHLVPALEEFEELLLKEQGIAQASVATAVPLSEDLKLQLKTSLEAAMSKTLLISWKVSPELIGGVLFKSGDTLVDSTLRTGLERLRHRLLHTRVV